LRKSGQKTDGKTYFYNGVAGKAEQEVEFGLQLAESFEPTFRRSLNRIDGYKFEKFKPEVIGQ
jgi:hypothetical protein